MAELAIVGAGLIGSHLARTAAATRPVRLVPARSLPAHGADLGGPDAQDLVFAHGSSVRAVQLFGRYARRRDFDHVLATRIEPMVRASEGLRARRSGGATVLVSSTVVDAPARAGRTLQEIQRRFEAAFLERFPDGSIVRVGTIVGPGSQMEDGLRRIGGTLLLKRLQLARDVVIRTCTLDHLSTVVGEVMRGPPRQLAYACDGEAGINGIFDQLLGSRRTVGVPNGPLIAIHGLLGTPCEFYLCGRESRSA